ncbi:hypothetical protein ABOM_012138 [Aspergillus bombycis]|uniref:HMG box domain-containing protein n=1 Tax=Aspergillus bombycis TaxID=109264 RepID=A0A1F7ZK38_9EURO|nr:hypothetical protein ABOM_012138 [Aspergillus bombycis]OGM39395.1 hypothetical protein ABOM_012138 [Aspergillus bombycis]
MRGSKDKRNSHMTLPCPLSELALDLPWIEVKDMEKWVRRPIPVRHKEAKNKHGRVKRPMNAFLLYRATYTELALWWLEQNSYELVSMVVGQSWNMEAENVKDKYRALASLEKQNHIKAHPQYRFRPRTGHRSSASSNRPNNTTGPQEADCVWTGETQSSDLNTAIPEIKRNPRELPHSLEQALPSDLVNTGMNFDQAEEQLARSEIPIPFFESVGCVCTRSSVPTMPSLPGCAAEPWPQSDTTELSSLSPIAALHQHTIVMPEIMYHPDEPSLFSSPANSGCDRLSRGDTPWTYEYLGYPQSPCSLLDQTDSQ